MTHLTRDKLYHLAELVVQDRGFAGEDVEDMQHIAQCDGCFEQLQQYMAALGATDNIDLYVGLRPRAAAETSEPSEAVIRVVILDRCALLEQMQSQSAQWIFEAPLVGAGNRSANRKNQAVAKLEDIDDEKCFVAYDSERKELVIQLRCDPALAAPKAMLELSDGNRMEIEFERREQLLRAKLNNLDDGEYKLILYR